MPTPFDVPQVTRTSEAAAADWQAAADQGAREGEAKAQRRAAGNGSPILNRSTLAFIRDGAGTGDRHRLLFSAAANLAEFGCTPALAVALLEESALDSGLSPKDVRRQVECGLAAVPSPSAMEPTQQAAPGSTQDAPDGSTVKEPLEAAASDSGSCGAIVPASDRGDGTRTGRRSTSRPGAALGIDAGKGRPGRSRAASADARRPAARAAAGPAAADSVATGGRRLGDAR